MAHRFLAYLGGQLVAETVRGIQSAGVIISVKHYNANEQETTAIRVGVFQLFHQTWTTKLWPFADAVHAGAGCIMCSYNRINNSYACQNSKTLNGLLKTELGFEGFVVSDWGAQHTGLSSAEAGLDVVMPEPVYWGESGGNLTISVKNGSLAESRVTDMATRIIAAWYQMGQDEGFPELGVGMALDYTLPHAIVNARDPACKPVLLHSAIGAYLSLHLNYIIGAVYSGSSSTLYPQ